MKNTYNIVKEIVESWKYKILKDDGDNIIILYQMNVVYICPYNDEIPFVSVLLTDFDELTEENYSEVVMRCNELNERLKQIKFYAIDDGINVTSEFFYMGKEDLKFQLKLALNNLIEAKVIYQNLYG